MASQSIINGVVVGFCETTNARTAQQRCIGDFEVSATRWPALSCHSLVSVVAHLNHSWPFAPGLTVWLHLNAWKSSSNKTRIRPRCGSKRASPTFMWGAEILATEPYMLTYCYIPIRVSWGESVCTWQNISEETYGQARSQMPAQLTIVVLPLCQSCIRPTSYSTLSLF